MSDKYQGLISGRATMVAGKVTSAGSGDGGKIVALDSSGKLDLSLFPTGMGPQVITLVASETLPAGKFINIWDDAGTAKARLADSTNDRPAHGFVKALFNLGDTASCYLRSGNNDLLSGQTPGARQYLGAAGGRMETVPTFPTHVIHQFLGISNSATSMVVDIEDEIVLS